MGKAVLVTGGAGFIGSHLVRALVAHGHSVRIVDNFSTGTRAVLNGLTSSVRIVEGDLCEREITWEVCRDIDTVFHHAALPSVSASFQNPGVTQRSGEVATLQLLEACMAHGVRRVILAASSSAYGDIERLPHIESMTPRPLSPYAASKLACEHYVSVFASSRGLDGVSLRYFNIFGPGQSAESQYSGVVTAFLSKLRSGQVPVIHGDGNQTRDFTYVDNVVRANLLAMQFSKHLNGRILNVGCGEQTSIKRLAAELNAALGTNLEPQFAPERPGDPRHSVADITLAREMLGYVPVVGFAEGIRQLVKSDSFEQAIDVGDLQVRARYCLRVEATISEGLAHHALLEAPGCQTAKLH